MGKFQALLNLRLKQKNTDKNKMVALAERTSSGELSSFSGVFRVSELNAGEKIKLQDLLYAYRTSDEYNVDSDLNSLSMITAEVKAITNQAVILHGERIKKAQTILKSYKDGAFTAWLMAAYGNRQTPYNFLQYYEFYTSMPEHLHTKIDEMPRQAVYSLASRSGEKDKKEEIVENHFAEPKSQLLTIIRRTFPLPEEDKRRLNPSIQVLSSLKRIKSFLQENNTIIDLSHKKEIELLLNQLLVMVKGK